MDEHANRMPKDSSELGHSTRGRPVTERVTLVNMGNRPHRDNGEEVATATSLPSCLFGTRYPRAALRLPWAMLSRPFGAIPSLKRQALSVRRAPCAVCGVWSVECGARLTGRGMQCVFGPL